MNQNRFFLLILALCLVLSGCSAAAAAPASDQASAETAVPSVLPKNWEPTLEVEQFSETGATVLFRSVEDTGNCLVLCGNDYFLERFTENGWEPVPTLTETVNWVLDAFVVTAVPRDDIDWQWLYGTLPNGHYRIGKTVALHQNGENLKKATVYGEFTLKTNSPETTEQVYDASGSVPSAAIYTYAPLESLPEDYSRKQAAADHVVIMQDGTDCENQHVWQGFVANAAAGQAVRVRCMTIDTAAGTRNIYDVSYDGFLYTVHWYENGVAQSLSFKHLLRYQGEGYEDPNATDRYVLTMDEDVTWEDIQWGMVSRNPNDAVSHKVVYQELAYHPAQPPIPDSSRVVLSLRGKELITAERDPARELVTLFRDAVVMAQKPDIYYMGLDLIFQGTDGSQVTLWLDLYGDHFLYDGTFYHYSTDALFEILDIETWPEQVLFAFPEDIHS